MADVIWWVKFLNERQLIVGMKRRTKASFVFLVVLARVILLRLTNLLYIQTYPFTSIIQIHTHLRDLSDHPTDKLVLSSPSGYRALLHYGKQCHTWSPSVIVLFKFLLFFYFMHTCHLSPQIKLQVTWRQTQELTDLHFLKHQPLGIVLLPKKLTIQLADLWVWGGDM